MSKYPPVRPKKKRGSKPAWKDRQDPADPRTPVEKAVAEAARDIYLQNDGEVIDQAIERAKRLLTIHDAEAKQLEADPQPGHRWTVSPSVARQWQRELEHQLKRRTQLMAECTQIARELVQSFMRQQEPGRGITPEELAAAEAAPERKERSTAEADTRAA